MTREGGQPLALIGQTLGGRIEGERARRGRKCRQWIPERIFCALCDALEQRALLGPILERAETDLGELVLLVRVAIALEERLEDVERRLAVWLRREERLEPGTRPLVRRIDLECIAERGQRVVEVDELARIERAEPVQQRDALDSVVRPIGALPEDLGQVTRAPGLRQQSIEREQRRVLGYRVTFGPGPVERLAVSDDGPLLVADAQLVQLAEPHRQRPRDVRLAGSAPGQ